MNKLFALSSIALLSLTLCACDGGASNQSPSAPVAPSAQSRASSESAPAKSSEPGAKAAAAQNAGEKVVRVSHFWVSPTLDAQDDFNGWVAVRAGLSETLFKLDDKGLPVPNLVKGFERLDDRSLKLELIPDLKFQDGSAVTAQDVKESLEHSAQNPRTPDYFVLEGIEVTDSHTLIIKTQGPNGALPNNLCEPLFALQKIEGQSDLKNRPLGTGPFRVTDFKPNASLTLERNPYFRGEPSAFDKVQFYQVEDANSRYLALLSGEQDLSATLDQSTLQQIEAGKDSDLKIARAPSPRVNVVYLNFKNPLLQNPKIREVLALCTDKEQIATLIGGTPAPSLFSKALPMSTDFEELYPYNLEKARQILKELGAEDTDHDGILNLDGVNLSFDYKFKADHGSADSLFIAQILEQNLKAAGIRLNLVPTQNLLYDMAQGDFDLASANDSSAPVGDGESFLFSHYHSRGQSNFQGYENAQVDALIESLQNTVDFEERIRLQQEIAYLLSQDLAALYINYLEGNEVYRSDLEGVRQAAFDYYFVDEKIRPQEDPE